jgi:protein ImuA
MMKELTGKKEIIKLLKEKILAMEGFSPEPDSHPLDFGLGPMVAAFPGGTFPVGAVHEFISPTQTSFSATNGFISGLLSTLMKKDGICLWVSSGRRLFPPSLKSFGIEPHRIIFIDVKREKEALWVMEQALKCNSLAAVVTELRDISFAESRRLQLAVEDSRVTGFLHRYFPRKVNTLGTVSRWRIRPRPSQIPDGLPGVGFPSWEVELEKIRNGQPGIWQLEWRNGLFRYVGGQKRPVPATGLSEKERYYA